MVYPWQYPFLQCLILRCKLLERVFALCIPVLAFTVGLFHLCNVSGLLVLSTRDVRIFHLTIMLCLLFFTSASFKTLANNTFDQALRVCVDLLSLVSETYNDLR